MSFFDLTLPVENGMTYYPGDPEPRITPVEVEPPWTVSELRLGSHTGTHMDAARHYSPGATAIDGYPVERFVVPGVVVALPGLADDQPITWEMVEPGLARLPAGGAVVLFMGWDRHFRDGRCLRHPYLAAETAGGLADAGAGIVGIDAMNPDSSAAGHDPRSRDAVGSRRAAGREPDRSRAARTRQALPLRLSAAAPDGSRRLARARHRLGGVTKRPLGLRPFKELAGGCETRTQPRPRFRRS